ncbi:MAG: alginate lyase family protein [Gammaproteobacteria bacterium]|nr:alginate lyase family protein [Gammaproteobacteria bacterium]
MRLSVALTACLVLVSQTACAGEQPPNILLIIADQHTGSVMTQRGYEHITTPGIDKIADAGVTFTRAYTPYPVCTAYRKSMMTGLMPSKITDATDHPSLGAAMQAAGYETVYHGKWHVGRTRISKVADWHGFETYDGRQRDTGTRERVVDFIRQEHDRPFFLVTSFMNPHDACELARNMSGIEDDYKDVPFDDKNIPLELAPPLPANFAIPPNEAEGFSLRRGSEPGDSMYRKHPTKFWTEDQWRQYMYGYDRLLEMVDAHIKLVIDELEAQGLLENTVVIYTSDHGDGHAAHQWNQKMTFYEEAINVPFIVSWKGKTKAGVIDEEMLSNTGLDIFPTILSFAGVPIPDSLHGLDLTSQVLEGAVDDETPGRDYVVSEINQAQYKGRMVVTQDFKYILFDGGKNPEQLFDLVNDPGELQPVTYDQDYRETLLAHRDMLVDWHDKISDEDFDATGNFPNLPAQAGVTFDREQILREADSYLAKAPNPVTRSSSERSMGGIHDFYSEGDYWWPDPDNPDGPYIRRDGQTNPDNFTDHRIAMRDLGRWVAALTAAYALTGEEKYADRAVLHLRTWFLDEATRMNPSLLYAQAIKGRVTGRGVGIIDTIHLIEVARSIEVLESKGALSEADLAGLKDWFEQYATWITTHPYGIDEGNKVNNHGTWWAAQLASFASLVGRDDLLELSRKRFKELLSHQMDETGGFHEELRRTKPYNYTLFNLEGYAVLAWYASTAEDDLWNYKTENGSLRLAIDYVAPFIADKSAWPHQADVQHFDEIPIQSAFLLLAGRAYADEDYLALWQDLPLERLSKEVDRNFPIRQLSLWDSNSEVQD